jgi:DNA-binding beta-propeller fold protein YncE
MNRYRRPLLLLAVLLPLAACLDEVPENPGDPLFRKGDKKCNPKKEDCTPPPPPVVEPDFPGPGLELISPVRVATTATGWLLVTETHQRAVLRVDPTTLLADQSFTVDGRPHAIGMLGDRVFVGNLSSHTVDVYNAQGQAVGYLGSPGSVGRPMDLAVDSVAGLVFVLDGDARNVKVFQASDGALVSTIGGGFVTPTGIALNPATQEVVVSDAGPQGGDAGILIYDYSGTFVTSISGAGSCGMMGCTGGFSTPASVALDSLGRVYLLDLLQRLVMVYDRANPSAPVETLDGTGTPLLQFPLDVAVAGGDVVVTSKRTHSLEAFRGVLP